ncbi:MAG: alpha/beta hydrolase [Oligoflexia bacterium]|nr:alpha/beta hydrolase [Oligoflexia bacterium]
MKKIFTYSILTTFIISILTVSLTSTANAKTIKAKAKFDAHESSFKYHFKDLDMDFTFGNLVLGSATTHGCEIGEAFTVASKIKDGDSLSWNEEWAKMAALVAARGEESLTNGFKISAREQFLRSSNYYRFALLAMLPTDPRLKIFAKNARDLFKKAGALFDPPIEYFEIPFEGTLLPGYFRKSSLGKSAKTLLLIGGGETFAEDLFFFIGPQTFERGYNFMTLDLPGQGILPFEGKQGKTFRADMYVAIKLAVDYALSKPEVDPEKLILSGYSGGGGFVPQAAMHDKRIKAIAMNSCVVNAYDLFATMPVVKANINEMKKWSSFHANTVKLINMRWGVPDDRPDKLVDANKGFEFDPTKINVPTLIVVGEGEYGSSEVKRQQKLCYDGIVNENKKLVITPKLEGATNHCVMENRTLSAQVYFDWFDKLFP